MRLDFRFLPGCQVRNTSLLYRGDFQVHADAIRWILDNDIYSFFYRETYTLLRERNKTSVQAILDILIHLGPAIKQGGMCHAILYRYAISSTQDETDVTYDRNWLLLKMCE